MENQVEYIALCRGHTYMPVSGVSQEYGQSRSTVYMVLKEISDVKDRYKGYWMYLNDSGEKLVNTLIYEDYLHYRMKLKHPTLRKTVPSFDPQEVRRQRGETYLKGVI